MSGSDDPRGSEVSHSPVPDLVGAVRPRWLLRLGAWLGSLLLLRRHDKKHEKSPDEKEVAEEASKRLELYVQKAVRTELESEVQERERE